jgi:TolB-like protein
MRPLLVVAFVFLTAAAPPTVAVSYFDNNTGDVALDPLAKGLADMLITDLSGLPAIRIVERDKLNRALDELRLAKSKFIDPATAVKLGKGLSAEYIMTGGYTLSGGALRIDARVFRVDSGAVVSSEKVEGNIAKVCDTLITRLPQDRALLSYCRNTIVPEIRRLKQNPDETKTHDAPRMKAMLAAYASLPKSP